MGTIIVVILASVVISIVISVSIAIKYTNWLIDKAMLAIAETTKEFVISNQHMSDALNDENLFKSDEHK